MVYESPLSMIETINSDVVSPSNGGPIVMPDDEFVTN